MRKLSLALTEDSPGSKVLGGVSVQKFMEKTSRRESPMSALERKYEHMYINANLEAFGNTKKTTYKYALFTGRTGNTNKLQ